MLPPVFSFRKIDMTHRDIIRGPWRVENTELSYDVWDENDKLIAQFPHTSDGLINSMIVATLPETLRALRKAKFYIENLRPSEEKKKLVHLIASIVDVAQAKEP